MSYLPKIHDGRMLQALARLASSEEYVVLADILRGVEKGLNSKLRSEVEAVNLHQLQGAAGFLDELIEMLNTAREGAAKIAAQEQVAQIHNINFTG